MNTILAIAAETIAVAAIVIAFQLVMLAFRNPFRPKWLGRFGIETLTAIAFASAIPVILGLQLSELMHAGAGFWPAAGIVLALLAGIVSGSAWMLQTRRRLKRADSGRSPFERLSRKVPGGQPPTAPAG